MRNSYNKFLKKMTNVEKRLKPNNQEISAILDHELEENTGLLQQKEDIVEEYRNLKENMNAVSMDCYSLAYSPVKTKHRKWSQQEL